MGKIGGFKEYARTDESNLAVQERVSNYNEFTIPLAKDKIKEQGSRCMDCGIPFCHSSCPLGNLIPDFNDMVHQEEFNSIKATIAKGVVLAYPDYSETFEVYTDASATQLGSDNSKE